MIFIRGRLADTDGFVFVCLVLSCVFSCYVSCLLYYLLTIIIIIIIIIIISFIIMIVILMILTILIISSNPQTRTTTSPRSARAWPWCSLSGDEKTWLE